MDKRIKELRKKLELTQQAFADKLGIRQNTIAKYETGRGNPTTSVIALICREFGVNETWLRTGVGEMFVCKDVITLDEFAKQHNATALEIEIVRAYFELDSTTRQELLQHFKKRFENATNGPSDISIMSEASATVEPIGNSDRLPPVVTTQLTALQRENEKLKQENEELRERERQAILRENAALKEVIAQEDAQAAKSDTQSLSWLSSIFDSSAKT